MRRFHRLSYLGLLALLAPLACSGDDGTNDATNDDVANDDDPLDEGDTTSGDGDGDPTEDGDGDGDPTTESTDTTDTTDATDATETDTTDTTETETTETGDPPDDSTYSAVIQPGGFNRLVVTRVNETEQSCSRMTLVEGMFDELDVVLPNPWAVEDVESWEGLECGQKGTGDYVALLGEGTIEFDAFDALGTYPCITSFDVTFTMSTDPYTDMHFQAQGVAVMGVNCG